MRFQPEIRLVSRERILRSALLVLLCFSVGWSWTVHRRQQRSALKSQSVNELLDFRNTRMVAKLSTRTRTTSLFSKQKHPYQTMNDSELIESIILAKTTKEVDRTLRRAFLAENSNQNQSWDVHHLIPSKENANNNNNKDYTLPVEHLSLNASAALLRRMAHISVSESRTAASANLTSTETIQQQNSTSREYLLVNLLHAIGNQLKSVRLHPVDQIKQELHINALTDVLQALAVLGSRSATDRERMKPLSSIVVELLDKLDNSGLYSLGPIQLVQSLQAISKLEIRHTHFHHRVFQRLLKPDAVSRLPARFLAHGLATFVSIQRVESYSSVEHEIGTINLSVKMLSRAFMRRLRKKKVIQEATLADLSRSLVATSELLKLGSLKGIENEAALFGFSCLRRAVDLRMEEPDSIHWTTNTLVDMLDAWATVTDHSREDTVIEQMLAISVEDKFLREYSMRQLITIFHSVQRLDRANHTELATAVGYQLVNLVDKSRQKMFANLNPSQISELLRWPILTNRKSKEIMKPYVDAATILFLEDSFLSRSSVDDITNFLWFLSSAAIYDQRILQMIGMRLLKLDTIEGCSPKMASRILASYSSLVADESLPSDPILEVQYNLFHNYGGHLLTSNLSPSDVSRSLYAYAKTNYFQDVGIFDHLVELLSSSRQDCTARQLSQGLWSCGRMMTWESKYNIDDKGEDTSDEERGPPYLPSAKLIAMELSVRTEELSPSDVAQVIWALGRLKLCDELLMPVFSKEASIHINRFSAGQIANILWGMAQTGQSDPDVVAKLAHRLISDSIHASPIEASAALHSLGKLNWCDQVVFEKLSRTLIMQMKITSAQSIANALWAYRTVGLKPPQQLLESWVIEKIGLKSALVHDN